MSRLRRSFQQKVYGAYRGQRCGGVGVGEKLSGRQSNSPSRRKNPLGQALPQSNCRLTTEEARTVDNDAVGKGKGMAKSFPDDSRIRRRVGRTRWTKQYIKVILSPQKKAVYLLGTTWWWGWGWQWRKVSWTTIEFAVASEEPAGPSNIKVNLSPH